jgi:hypothetical protein
MMSVLAMCSRHQGKMIRGARQLESYRAAGRCRNYAIQALETKHKFAVKAVAHKTNNQAAVGKSILDSNIQMEASESLAIQINITGVWRACRPWCTLLANFSLPLCTLCALCAFCANLMLGLYT